MRKLDIIGLAFGIAGMMVMLLFIISLIPEHLNIYYDLSLEKASNIGDFIGGVVGIFFSIAAFVLLYETLHTQREELNENKKIFQKQAFENNLFQMINMHNDFIKEFDIRKGMMSSDSEKLINGEIIATGKDSFKFIYNNDFNKNVEKSKLLEKSYINEKLDDLLFEWDDDLNHYFKHSLEIIRYIYSSSISFESLKNNPLYYTRLFSSGLSTSEEILLFYYIVFKGDKEIKKIVEHLNFFKNMPTDKLLSTEHYNWIYE